MHYRIINLFAQVASGLLTGPVLAATNDSFLARYVGRQGDRIARHLDRRGDRINHRRGRTGDRIDRRMDRRARHIDRWTDRLVRRHR